MAYSATYTVYEQNHFDPFDTFRDGELGAEDVRKRKFKKGKRGPITTQHDLYIELGTIYADTYGEARNRFNSGRMAGTVGNYEQ